MKLTGYQVFRLICLGLLWAFGVWLVVAYQPFTLRIAFIVIASAIIVFVPVLKKFRRQNGQK